VKIYSKPSFFIFINHISYYNYINYFHFLSITLLIYLSEIIYNQWFLKVKKNNENQKKDVQIHIYTAMVKP